MGAPPVGTVEDLGAPDLASPGGSVPARLEGGAESAEFSVTATKAGTSGYGGSREDPLFDNDPWLTYRPTSGAKHRANRCVDITVDSKLDADGTALEPTATNSYPVCSESAERDTVHRVTGRFGALSKCYHRVAG